MIRVSIDDALVQDRLKKFRQNISESASLMRRLSFDLRDYVRETMRMQGRKRPWAPLAPMTMLRTGRRKPLTTLVLHIQSSYTPTSVQVFFRNPKGGDWTIEQHHKGFNIPPRIGRQGFFTARTNRPVFFMTSKGARVPAREIIPTKAEVQKVVNDAIRDWLEKGRR